MLELDCKSDWKVGRAPLVHVDGMCSPVCALVGGGVLAKRSSALNPIHLTFTKVLLVAFAFVVGAVSVF